jgi:Flp pilus assembly pilin Flp
MRYDGSLLHSANFFLKDESGGSLMEYALVGLLIAVVCALALLAFRKNI